MPARHQVALSRRRRQNGSALIELSLCLLAFLFMSLGGMEAGWGVYAYNFTSYAAQDAARYAAVNGSQSLSPATSASVTSFVQAEAVGLTTSQLSVNTTWSPDNTAGSTVTVTVGYNIQPLAGLAFNQSLYVSSTASMYIDH